LVAAAAAVWFFGPAPEGGDGETNGVDVAVHRRPAPPLSNLPARAPERREEREASALPEPVPVEPDLRIDVVDPDDLPLPGAVVTLLRANEHGDLELSETVARTDSSGRARFEAEVLRSFAELHVLVD